MSDDTTMWQWLPQSSDWENWHKTIEGPIDGVYIHRYPPDNPAFEFDAINRCTRQIQRSIAHARAAGRPVRGIGRGWSLSDITLPQGRMIDISLLNGRAPVKKSQIDPAYPGGTAERRKLWLVQGGTYISEINKTLESNQFGRSLQTSGAANGQTIIGATSTGTHGSALHFGALHDHIVAIHLITNETTQYWMERESYPVTKESVALNLGAKRIRDDDLFNAVVMGLGAFGIIHNVVIETRPRFLLEAINNGHLTDPFDIPDGEVPQLNRLFYDDDMRKLIATLDFAAHPSLKPPAGFAKPYFFQPIIDPNTTPVEVLVTQMYKLPWKQGYQPNYAARESTFGPGYDFLSVVGFLLDRFQRLTGLFADIARAQLFNYAPKTGSWGEQFGYKAPRTKVASGSVAVPLDRAIETLDALIDLNKRLGGTPLVFGCRYVRKSPALLAFNKWDTTLVVSVDGVENAKARQFFKAMPDTMEAAGIPFTQHWGKTNHYTKQRIATAYGDNAMHWIAAREELLPDPADRAMFENDYLRARGLV
ncbi:MAG: FAD-binding protein [Sphingomonadaceae bacterium]|nr:FAD-binding protein [Sphingomonadaceae bacterium]